MNKENKDVKSSVFADLFQECPEAKENALSLYNALNNTDYENPENIRHISVKDTIYKNFKNDVSFLFGDKVVVLIEHQSTINKNMPLRMLMYLGRLYEKLFPVRTRYKRNLVKLPIPELYVLYNGVEDSEIEYELKLSDSYDGEAPIEIVVKVLNINTCKKHPILEKCKILQEYSRFNDVVEKYKYLQTEDAYKEAIDECIRDGILNNYLLREGSEVINMLIAEYDYDMDIEVQREEAFTEGKEKERELLNQLTRLLIAEKRYEDLDRAAEDIDYQDKLLHEYNLV